MGRSDTVPGRAASWRVGELAHEAGLTVRTLHHWDRIGLLTPSARTPAGHRLYSELDVRRLYQVVALRELGLDLDRIGAVLADDPGLARVLREHLVRVDGQLAAARRLRARLTTLVDRIDRTDAPTSADLLGLIDEVTKMDEKMRTYFTDEELATLSDRGGAGEAAAARWPGLIGEVQAEMDAGTDPAEPRVRALAQRWMELLESFHRGDPGLRDSLYRMQAENAEEIERDQGGPSPQMIDYISRANAAG